MYKFTKRVFVNRSQQDVFDFMSDPAHLNQWQPTIESAAWTSPGMPGVGSTYKLDVKMFGRTSETLFEITSWDPPNRYGYRSVNISSPVESIESVISLAPMENGTQMTFEAHLAASGLFKLIEGMFGKLAEKTDGKNIDTAKQLLEGG